MRHTLAAFLIALAPANVAADEPSFQWKLDEAYQYTEFHDPGVLVIENAEGVRSEIDFGYQGLTFKTLESWESGRPIRVIYTPENGTVIFDPASGESYAISGRIRIDDLLRQCMAAAASMATRLACQSQAGEAWDSELNRAYKSAMAGTHSDTTKQKIRDAQRKWLVYRDASIEAFGAWASDAGGSISQLEAAIAGVDLTRSQTHKLRLY